MKKISFLLLSMLLLLSFASCAAESDTPSAIIPSSEPEVDEEEVPSVFPGLPGNNDSEEEIPSKGTEDTGRDQKSGQPEDQSQRQKSENQSQEAQEKSTLYPPSIFVIEASGTWRQELAPGYYADYECEFYADKLDETDNQSASGQYTGVFWMKTELEADEYLKELLKNVPVEMQFDAGGEGVCDFFNVVLMNGFERDSTGGNYAIPDGQGGTLTPAGEVLAARGSFVAEALEAYLEVRASGAAGETIEHQDTQSESTEIDFILHVEPDPDFTALERKVTLYLSTAEGMSVTLDGVLRRMPGYSEDLKAYTSQGKRGEILDKHLQ